MSSKFAKLLLRLMVLSWIVLVPLQAQDQWHWPDKAKNLKVLPKNTSAERLRDVMHGFTEGLGVRCSYCHKGEPGQPFTEWDFASDDIPKKDAARLMMRMVGDIHNDLAKMDHDDDHSDEHDHGAQVTCYTCHHGRHHPMTLAQELAAKYHRGGLALTLVHYQDLKIDYHGRGVFDFGENSLNLFGYDLLQDGETADAIKIFQTNADLFPESANVWDSLAEAYLKSGDKKLAKQYYEKAVALDPRNRHAREMLKQLQ